VFASVSAIELLFIVVVWALVVVIPAFVTVAKGHIALFFAGFLLLGLIWWIAAWRLAKPNSPWAKRFYGPEKQEKSRRRYEHVDPAQPSRAGLAAAIGFGLLGISFVVGLVAGVAR
jgi:hypothetical protein